MLVFTLGFVNFRAQISDTPKRSKRKSRVDDHQPKARQLRAAAQVVRRFHAPAPACA